MDKGTYDKWWPLHLRVALGEELGDGERLTYKTGLAELERDEVLVEDVEGVRLTRARLAELDRERRELESERFGLDARIAALEAQLRKPAHGVVYAGTP